MNERKDVEAQKTELEMNKARALAIHCMDFRFQSGIQQQLEELGLIGEFDRLSWPGASQDAETVIKAVNVSLEKHDPDQIFIIEHEDCGAYEDNSIETHRQNAQKLADALRALKPSLKITPLIATFQGIKPL